MEGDTCMKDGEERAREGMLDCRQCQNFRFFLFTWDLEL